MKKIEKIFNIPEIKDNCRFWMIRTNDGEFYDEFVNNEFVAIGWNLMTKKDLRFGMNSTSQEFFKKKIEKEYNQKRPQAAINKCIRFVNELKENDIAVIIGRNRLSFVKLGSYYETESGPDAVNKELNYSENKGEIFNTECPYIKRRKIEIIKKISSVDELNPYLYKVIYTNMHSLSSLDRHSEFVLNSCYDSYIRGNNISVTFHIERESDIPALELTGFINHTANLLSGGSTDRNISVKTNLHSPGDVILQGVGFVKDNYLIIGAILLVIFGGKGKNWEFNSLYNIILELIDIPHKKRMQALQEAKLTADVRQQQLQNEILEYEHKKKLLSESLPHIMTASETLEIRAANSEIFPKNVLKKLIDESKKDF